MFVIFTKKSLHSHLLTIDSKRYSPIALKYSSKQLLFEEIIEEFKSLENLDSELIDEKEFNVVEKECDKFMQLNDYRRPKYQEQTAPCISKFRKLNKSHTMQEMRKKDLELKLIAMDKRMSKHRISDHGLILTEFIL